MDLSTKYMGLTLRNPLVLSACPLTEKLENFKKLEDAGIGAIVMHSLFEEQIRAEQEELNYHLTQGTDSFAESLSYFPDLDHFKLGPEQYLDQIRKAKKAVQVPIIASLNGNSEGGWTQYAKQIEAAGADAIELNIFFLSTDPEWNSDWIENTYEVILRSVKTQVKIPVAVKMHPFFSSFAYMAKCLDEAGADGLVLFNRFYQPDIDLDKLEVCPTVQLSSPVEQLLPLRWISILRSKIKASLAATTGVYEAEDVVKMLLVGADAVMVCSTVLKNGTGQIKKIMTDLQSWMTAHEYGSVAKMKGILTHAKCADPRAFERANYMKVLNSYPASR